MNYNEKQQNDSDPKKQSGDFNKKNAGGNNNPGNRNESRNAGSSSPGGNVNQAGQRPDQQRSDIKSGSQDTRSKGNM